VGAFGIGTSAGYGGMGGGWRGWWGGWGVLLHGVGCVAGMMFGRLPFRFGQW